MALALLVINALSSLAARAPDGSLCSNRRTTRMSQTCIRASASSLKAYTDPVIPVSAARWPEPLTAVAAATGDDHEAHRQMRDTAGCFKAVQ